MHLVSNLTKKAIPLQKGERAFFSDGETLVFLLMLGPPASKVDVLLQSGVRASFFPTENAWFFFSHLDFKSGFRCGLERAIFFLRR